MPVDPKDFPKHKLVLAHLIMNQNNVEGANRYADKVTEALAGDLSKNPQLEASVNDMEEFLAILRAAKENADEHDQSVHEYLTEWLNN